MEIVIHRVNSVAVLQQLPERYGVEIDVRGYGQRLLLSHEPLDNCSQYDELGEYLKYCQGRFVIFNLKEAGYEQRIIELAERSGLKDYFLLDVEFPYLYTATRKLGFRKIAVRYSEAEPIENVLAQMTGGHPLLDWVWIDTNTRLPLDRKVMASLQPFKTCLVCPERWGRPEDIQKYQQYMNQKKIRIDAVMTALPYAAIWETF